MPAAAEVGTVRDREVYLDRVDAIGDTVASTSAGERKE